MLLPSTTLYTRGDLQGLLHLLCRHLLLLGLQLMTIAETSCAGPAAAAGPASLLDVLLPLLLQPLLLLALLAGL
jgi:hypothetical protein